jgi:hypothetical protein
MLDRKFHLINFYQIVNTKKKKTDVMNGSHLDLVAKSVVLGRYAKAQTCKNQHYVSKVLNAYLDA